MIRTLISMLTALGLALVAPAFALARPRVVKAKDAPAAREQPLPFPASLPQPKKTAVLRNPQTFRLLPQGRAMRATGGKVFLHVIESTDKWLYGRLVVEGGVLAVYVETASAETVAVRETVFVPSISDLAPGLAGNEQIPRMPLEPGTRIEVLQIEGEAARVRVEDGALEATGYLPRQDTGKVYTWTGIGQVKRCADDDRQRHLLRSDAKLMGQPGGPVFVTLKARDEDYSVTILAKRGRHVLICSWHLQLVAWARARDVRSRRDNDPRNPAYILGGFAGGNPQEAPLHPSTLLYDRPGGDIVGYLTQGASRPIGDAAPGDWVETTFATRLGVIPVWFQVPAQ